MSEFSIFYSWQSDATPNHNRHLIREALDLATDTIGKDEANPYKIIVQSDTENLPGLVNIPETLLKRLRESDAVVFDLSFVARTNADEPKYCSNPNVLFELGYAFKAIGPERLICVVNEAHGSATEQIFDLAHHRRPIAYTSPQEGKSRSDAVAMLAASLESAIRGVMKLGPIGGFGGDDAIQHQRNLSDIESFWNATGHERPNRPFATIWSRPRLFRGKRWADAQSIEAVLRSATVRNRNGEYPPQIRGNASMDWGLYNDMYGDPWTLTYAGQFWTRIDLGAHSELTLDDRDVRLSPEPPNQTTIPPCDWMIGEIALRKIHEAFRFMGKLSESFSRYEPVEFGIDVKNIKQRWMQFHRHDVFGPCRSPFLTRTFETTVGESQTAFDHASVSAMKDLCDMFTRDGRVITRDVIEQTLN